MVNRLGRQVEHILVLVNHNCFFFTAYIKLDPQTSYENQDCAPVPARNDFAGQEKHQTLVVMFQSYVIVRVIGSSQLFCSRFL